ncbi:MAG: translation initiation factor IF-3 [Alphaproteobacteria bacterium]|nr:MAG: translation initiation factor IF-3 [Alphaproteobacteria bacterium]
MAPQPRSSGPRVNDAITARQVRLIGPDGQNHGIVDIHTALEMAEEAGLDLVEIAPQSTPPVCKVMDFGKYKYEQQKKAAAAKKKQKTQEVKELKMRPTIDDHDFDTKMKAAERFLTNGDKVKLTIRFRGRELSHQDLGRDVLERARERLDELGKVESGPKMEGRQMTMVLAPAR